MKHTRATTAQGFKEGANSRREAARGPRRVAAALVIFSLLFLMLGCSSRASHTKVVAIATLMNQPALDQVQTGLKEELAKRGWISGKNMTLIIRNANGQMQLAASIAQELVSLNPDVVVPITTPMAQAVVKIARCPVVFAAVTDPVGAGVVSSLEDPGPNVTGTSDAWPYRDQLRVIREILPHARRLGVLFNPGEAASQYGIRQIRKFAPPLGFTLVEGAVSSTAEVYPVALNLAPRVDALLLSSDNTVIGGVAGAVKVATAKKVPLFAGDSGTVKEGALAAVSVGYLELGRETGRLVDEELGGHHNIPVWVAGGSEVFINTKAAQLMGVTIPRSILQGATKVYTTIQESR
jgi:putative tryptophan/tyrosine transport system substrate-binding protein